MKTPIIVARFVRQSTAFSLSKFIGTFWLALISIAWAVPPNAPILSLSGGTYTTLLMVVSSSESLPLYYTTDGTVPNLQSSQVDGSGHITTGSALVNLNVRAYRDSSLEWSTSTTTTYVITGQVSTSGSHTLVLRTDGTVWASGKNDFGQLGDGTTNNAINFKQVMIPAIPGSTPATPLAGVIAVAAGGNHSLALKQDGTVWAWGLNTNSQCGASASVHQIPVLANVVRIAAGATHSVALTTATGGTVYTWGGAANGQQGNGSSGANSDRPVPGSVMTGVKEIACGGGGSHTVALTNSGTVYCWGLNTYGQNGTLSYTTNLYPTQAYALSGVAAIAAGTNSSLAVTSTGSVFGWGSATYTASSGGGVTSAGYGNAPTVIPGLTNIASVAAGDGYVLAIKTDQSVVGLGSSNQLGLGNGTAATTPVSLPALGTVLVLAAGNQSSLAITSAGTVWAWGGNTNGALGLGVASQKNVPIELLSPNVVEVAGITAGSNHNLVEHFDGTIWGWGANSSGQLGAGDLLQYAEPHQALSITGLLSTGSVTAAGNDFSLVVRANGTNGTVAAAGQNTYGQLGAASSVSRSTTFITIGWFNSNNINVVAVGAGRQHGLAIGNTVSVIGQVYSWGSGLFGQLGNGTSPTQQYTPVAVSGLTLVSKVAGGQYHSVALKADGSVWAWGYNTNGQVGNTTSTSKTIPNQVGLTPSGGTPVTGVTFIAAGLNHNLASKTDGSIVSWGANSEGQIGDNTIADRTTPVAVPSLTDVVRVAAGNKHSLALKADGTVWAWGRNVEGQLGDGTNLQRKTPVQVLGLSGIVEIAAGDYHSLARKEDGGVVSWGSNAADQLGIGLSVIQLTPLAVPGVNVFRGAPGVTIVSPATDSTYAMGESFGLQVSVNTVPGFFFTKVSYFNDGFKLADAVVSPFSTTLAVDTWGDFNISATAYDTGNTPSFPSPTVTIHIPPPITLNGFQSANNSISLNWSTTMPNASTTFRLEKRLPGSQSIIIQSIGAQGSYVDSPLLYQPAYYYRVVGTNGPKITAMSSEYAVLMPGFEDNEMDGLADDWERQYFNGTNDPNGAVGADPDGDGVINILEFRYHLDPRHSPVTDTTGALNFQVFTPREPLN